MSGGGWGRRGGERGRGIRGGRKGGGGHRFESGAVRKVAAERKRIIVNQNVETTLQRGLHLNKP